MFNVIKIISAVLEEAQSTIPEIMEDSEQPSLPPEVAAIEAAREVFAPEEDTGPPDIMKIINSCLQDVRRDKSKHAIKSLSLLISVTEYIKLCTNYRARKACKQPCLKASTAIARRMGRGPYFARQIRHTELYLMKHRRLPLPMAYTRGGHHSLLDNEALLHDVRVYLAAQDLGTVTPLSLCQHINTVILPALEIEGTISEITARRWLKLRLGYECKETKKGIYIDGHERPDVIKERMEFLERLAHFEPYVARTQFTR
jgi:hypothetical protein